MTALTAAQSPPGPILLESACVVAEKTALVQGNETLSERKVAAPTTTSKVIYDGPGAWLAANTATSAALLARLPPPKLRVTTVGKGGILRRSVGRRSHMLFRRSGEGPGPVAVPAPAANIITTMNPHMVEIEEVVEGIIVGEERIEGGIIVNMTMMSTISGEDLLPDTIIRLPLDMMRGIKAGIGTEEVLESIVIDGSMVMNMTSMKRIGGHIDRNPSTVGSTVILRIGITTQLGGIVQEM